jgi:hypothetical protein
MLMWPKAFQLGKCALPGLDRLRWTSLTRWGDDRVEDFLDSPGEFKVTIPAWSKTDNTGCGFGSGFSLSLWQLGFGLVSMCFLLTDR